MSPFLPYPSQSRRSKTVLSPDGQTAKFLYTMIKQLDLKTVDWNEIASQLSITNGHAARMRYSRFKKQIEGLIKEPTPRSKPNNVKGGKPNETIGVKRRRDEAGTNIKSERFVVGFDHGVHDKHITKKVKCEDDRNTPDANSGIKIGHGSRLDASSEVRLRRESGTASISHLQPRIHHPVMTSFAMHPENGPQPNGSMNSSQKPADASQDVIPSRHAQMSQMKMFRPDVQARPSSIPAYSQRRPSAVLGRIPGPFTPQYFNDSIYHPTIYGRQSISMPMAQPLYFQPHQTYQQPHQIQNQYRTFPGISSDPKSHLRRTATSHQTEPHFMPLPSAGYEPVTRNPHLWPDTNNVATGNTIMTERMDPGYRPSIIASSKDDDLNLARAIMETDFGQWTANEMEFSDGIDSAGSVPISTVPSDVTRAIIAANTNPVIGPDTRSTDVQAHLQPLHHSEQEAALSSSQYKPGANRAEIIDLDPVMTSPVIMTKREQDDNDDCSGTPSETQMQESDKSSVYGDPHGLLPISMALSQPSRPTGSLELPVPTAAPSIPKSTNHADLKETSLKANSNTTSCQSQSNTQQLLVSTTQVRKPVTNDRLPDSMSRDELLRETISSGIDMWEQHPNRRDIHHERPNQPQMQQTLPTYRHGADQGNETVSAGTIADVSM